VSDSPRVEAGVRARLVLLGASNVRRALPELVREARWRLGGPLDVVVSHGSGRSYLGPSRLLGRGLEAIAPEAFWTCASADDLPLHALVADAGNDLAYGSPPEPVAAAIERAVERLAELGARAAVVGMPLEVLDAISPIRFHAARALLFPTRRIERARILADARALDAELARIAGRHGAAFVAPRADWYGVDPIHVRLRARADAARVLLAHLGPRAAEVAPHGLELIRLGRLKPARWSWFGRGASWPQPSVVLADGTRVSWI
jgi:hypothetical protein